MRKWGVCGFKYSCGMAARIGIGLAQRRKTAIGERGEGRVLSLSPLEPLGPKLWPSASVIAAPAGPTGSTPGEAGWLLGSFCSPPPRPHSPDRLLRFSSPAGSAKDD